MQKIVEKIRIIVPAYNADNTIKQCIDAILNALYCFVNWELVIVDNGQNTKLNILLESYPVQLIKATKIPSAAYARNKGAENFSEGIIAFIDSDVIIEKECLRILIEPIIKKKEVATIGNYSKDVSGLNFAQKYKQLYIHYIYNQSKSSIRNDFWTAISAINASVFHNLNGFDTSFKGANGEDQEFGIRLSKNNYSIACTDKARGKHINPYTIKKIIKNDFRKGITALKNCYNNNVPLADNRHAKGSSICSVIFACLFICSLAFIAFNFYILIFSSLLLLTWLLLRYNLIKVYLNNLGIGFTLKAISLIFILDIVRSSCIITGLFQNLFLN